MIAEIQIGGEPRARGRAHGLALKPRIHAHIADWLGSLERAGLGPPTDYVRDLLRETDFLPAIRRHTPDLLEEVTGMAQGADADPDLIFALQLMDEEWAYRRRRARAGPLEKCSSFAILTPGGPTWIGQNMDLGAYTDSYQALLRIEEGGASPGALVFTIAGIIGLMGVNAAGLGLCLNSLPQLPSAPEGLPVAFVLRRLLRAGSLAEAVDLMLSLPHATNQHYLLAGFGAVRSFEASAEGVVEYRSGDPTRVLHTNHPLGEVAGEPQTAADRANSAARLASLQARLTTGSPGLDELQAALSSCDDPRNPVCRIPDPDAGLIGFTNGSMISAIGEDGVESWISAGPPSEHGYNRFSVR